jgi:hypothetical protein
LSHSVTEGNKRNSREKLRSSATSPVDPLVAEDAL